MTTARSRHSPPIATRLLGCPSDEIIPNDAASVGREAGRPQVNLGTVWPHRAGIYFKLHSFSFPKNFLFLFPPSFDSLIGAAGCAPAMSCFPVSRQCRAEYCKRDIGNEVHVVCAHPGCKNFQLCLQVPAELPASPAAVLSPSLGARASK